MERYALTEGWRYHLKSRWRPLVLAFIGAVAIVLGAYWHSNPSNEDRHSISSMSPPLFVSAYPSARNAAVSVDLEVRKDVPGGPSSS
jgi:hypothetical protein